jgi:hypothetical protein
MSQAVRHTLATLATLVAVLALGLVAVAFGTSALDGSGSPEGVALAATSEPPEPDARAERPGAAAHVKLVIDYGDGVQKHFVAIEHKAGMTVLDALQAARAHPRGVEVEHSGGGATALVRRIDDLKNQGGSAGEGGARNWQFYVNDRYATAGAGATKLEPGDVVRWVFAPYTGGR